MEVFNIIKYNVQKFLLFLVLNKRKRIDLKIIVRCDRLKMAFPGIHKYTPIYFYCCSNLRLTNLNYTVNFSLRLVNQV